MLEIFPEELDYYQAVNLVVDELVGRFASAVDILFLHAGLQVGAASSS